MTIGQAAKAVKWPIHVSPIYAIGDYAGVKVLVSLQHAQQPYNLRSLMAGNPWPSMIQSNSLSGSIPRAVIISGGIVILY